MNCLILAAGQGKRLFPLTKSCPKCLVEINKKSILDWQLLSLNKAGIIDINIVGGYQKNKIEKLKDKRLKKIYFNKEYKKTNMVMSLLAAKELFYDNLIISYSDILYSNKIVSLLVNSEYKNSIIVDIGWLKLWSKRFSNPLEDAESLIYDKEFTLVDIGAKTNCYKDIMAQYIGLMKFELSTLELIDDLYKKNFINKNLFMTDLIMILLEQNINIKVIPVNRGWIEIDSISDLNLYENEIKKIDKKDNIYSILS